MRPRSAHTARERITLLGKSPFAVGLLAAGGFLAVVGTVGVRLCRNGSLGDPYGDFDEVMFGKAAKQAAITGLIMAGAGFVKAIG